MKAEVATFNQEKALVGAFSVIVKTGCGTDGALQHSTNSHIVQPEDGGVNLDMGELDEALEAAKEVEHLVRGWRSGLSQGSR